jgi:erythromycin esterase
MRTQLFGAGEAVPRKSPIGEFRMSISAHRIRHRGPLSAATACLGRLLLLEALASALLCGQSYLNLSFETASSFDSSVSWSPVPTGWEFYGPDFQFALDTSTAVDGAQSLRIKSLTGETTQFGEAYEFLTAEPAIGNTFHLSGYIRTQAVNGNASLWANVYDAQSKFLAGGNSPLVAGTQGWQRYDLYMSVPAGAVGLNFGVMLNGTGTAWFDNLSIDVNGQPYFPNPAAQQVQWIQANAIPFTSLDPDADFTELMPLQNIIGTARVVGLGEGTHGTSEFWRMKTRLFSFLVQEMGFTILAMEANMPEAARLNDYVQTGIGDPKELLKGMNYFNWNMQEILDLIDWMRQYNASGKGHVEFMGLDVNMAIVAMENVIGFVRKADPSLLASVASSYAAVGALQLPGGDASSLSQYEAGQTAAQSVLDQLQSNRAKYLQTMSNKEVDWAIQNATVALQAVLMSIDRIDGTGMVRDGEMAANAEWIAAHAPPGSRIVLWMHNAHINKEPGTTGGILAQYFGSDYVTFATAFHSGEYFACTGAGCPGEPPGATGEFPALASFPGSAEYFFHETGTPQQILNLGLANANDPASSWLLGGLEFRGIGYPEADGFWEFAPTSRLTPDFDGLIFFDQTTAGTELPNGPMDLTVLAPGNALCGSLDMPYLQAPAPGAGSPLALPDGAAGVAYTKPLEAGGGVCSAWPNTVPASCPTGVWPLYGNWTVTAGALPAGLTLSSDGVLSGIPTEAGLFTFTVQTANNLYPETALGQLQLRIDTHLRSTSVQGSPGCEVISRKPLLTLTSSGVPH